MTTTYQPYPEYKDSGIEWLGQIPTTWKLSPLKYLATIKNGQDYKAVQVNEGYPVMGSGGQFAYASAFMYDKPSVLLGRKGTVDKPLYINQPFWTVDTMYYTEINEDVDAKYLYYLALTIQFGRYITSTALPSMTQENLANYTFAIPEEKQERNRIADFLDHETAKIDTLIDKQQQLIKLLKEKRQAVISHAVTKGLNPDVPMKDSGVEWLGEVPEHWSLPKINHVARVMNGSTPNKNNMAYWENGSIPWLASSCLNAEIVEEPTAYISESAYSATSVQIVPANSLLVGMVGQGKTRGSSAILGLDSCINQNIAAIIPCNEIETRYIYYIFQVMYDDLRELGRGGNQAALNCEIIGALKIPFPPRQEQKDILDSLKNYIEKIKLTEKRAEQQVRLLQERRAALISAAVTGKIDVRGWQAEQRPSPQPLSQR